MNINHAEKIRRTMHNAHGRALKDQEMMFINTNVDDLRVALIAERARVERLQNAVIYLAEQFYYDQEEGPLPYSPERDLGLQDGDLLDDDGEATA